MKSQYNKEMGMCIINIEVYSLMLLKHIIIQLFSHNDLSHYTITESKRVFGAQSFPT